MIREDRFVLSHRPYVVDLSSLTGEVEPVWNSDRSVYRGQVNAVWYRRRKGVTVACIGTLWDLQDEKPADALEFLARHDDGRYGGNCEGRWDGHGYWGAEDPKVVAAHLAVLRPMLAAYPNLPGGYDGWYRF